MDVFQQPIPRLYLEIRVTDWRCNAKYIYVIQFNDNKLYYPKTDILKMTKSFINVIENAVCHYILNVL